MFINFIVFVVRLYCNCIPAPAIKLNKSLGDVDVTTASLPDCSAPVAEVEFTFILPKPFAPCMFILPEPTPPIISHCAVLNTPCVVLTFALHHANTWSSPVVAGSSTITGWYIMFPISYTLSVSQGLATILKLVSTSVFVSSLFISVLKRIYSCRLNDVAIDLNIFLFILLLYIFSLEEIPQS